jgi:UDP-N-acetylglucosamine 2-epimerase (non-hydrolysing)
LDRKILIVYGTRPEAIKMAPVVARLEQSDNIEPVVAVTGQHRALLDQVNQLFGITPNHDLDIITHRQTLESITTRSLAGVSDVICAEQPDAMLVQGDTTTCFAAALAAFYKQVPVIHLEAGLRTNRRYDPFPEEMNRLLTTQLASLHLAPTNTSRSNLLKNGVSDVDIVVTGNTVIDALIGVVSRDLPIENILLRRTLANVRDRNVLLVTSHRRESWGQPMQRTADAIARIARAHPELVVILPAHLNPVVREVLLPPLAGLTNVVITDPLSYSDFSQALNRSTVILTDSGGVQEEAPSLGKPVLVMRETTERPEAVTAGTVRLVGTDSKMIFDEVSTLISDQQAYERMARAMNPYGDGQAARRAVTAIEHFFGLSERPDSFIPPLALSENPDSPDGSHHSGRQIRPNHEHAGETMVDGRSWCLVQPGRP